MLQGVFSNFVVSWLWRLLSNLGAPLKSTSALYCWIKCTTALKSKQEAKGWETSDRLVKMSKIGGNLLILPHCPNLGNWMHIFRHQLVPQLVPFYKAQLWSCSILEWKLRVFNSRWPPRIQIIIIDKEFTRKLGFQLRSQRAIARIINFQENDIVRNLNLK